MVPTKKEESKDDLDDAIFKPQDKQEDVECIISELEDAALRDFSEKCFPKKIKSHL